jgi:L-asparaginase
MKNILIIHTGGTFAMTVSGSEDTLIPGNLQNELIEHVPEIQKIANIEVEIPLNKDSAESGIYEWRLLSKLIYQRMEKYDGFVIIHGTDTMAYTASALSFSLLNFRKPIVLTGAQRPLSKLRSDARYNLIDAIELATMDIPEVLIVFGAYILRGNRSTKVSTSRYDAFDSPNFPHLGQIGLNIELDQSLILKPRGASILLEGFSDKVGVISVQPSMNIFGYKELLNADIKAILIFGFGIGSLPSSQYNWLAFIEEAVQKNIAVIIGTQSQHGMVKLGLYANSQRANEAGAIGIGNMTKEAAYVKLQKILTLTDKVNDIYEKFLQDWAGER